MFIEDIEWRDPVSAFAPLAGEPYAHLLHGGQLSSTADWTVIAAFPSEVIEPGAGSGNLFQKIDKVLEQRKTAPKPTVARLPFISGILGLVGYETASIFEPTLSLPPSPYGFPELSLGIYDAAALFSRREKSAYVAGVSKTACQRLADSLGESSLTHVAALPQFLAQNSNFTRDAYMAAVSGVIENILDGDYYQANISQRIECVGTESIKAFKLFQKLASQSDAAFSALLQLPNGSIVSNSPERFFQITHAKNDERNILTEPVKGTRPRGQTLRQDERYAQELLDDPKDRAENIMIADLLRNDLSKICIDGTISEDAICDLMSLTNVHHLVSRISGALRPDVSFSDVFAALFPCGSITGAPKLEAMKAIARVERVGRGPYCGAIGYMDDRGNADFAVAIRTLMVEGGKVTIPVGGGVTLRSDPVEEYKETLVKAKSMLAALGFSENMTL
ncbi:anthranilate synthase component I family protein [Hyphococcus flavus]|uniref:Anthranilate synthase component I family protein n=1 Tax=Hyphococcus flavus TaxID=1866326 RepID=A0AAE9ZL77_9PROT|nr:anthranilate synthase component I family protein [Hyphococcus flavus]WDI33186.1 anthranilate synthase component I family protein [Hyphococcus flavus]